MISSQKVPTYKKIFNDIQPKSKKKTNLKRSSLSIEKKEHLHLSSL